MMRMTCQHCMQVADKPASGDVSADNANIINKPRSDLNVLHYHANHSHSIGDCLSRVTIVMLYQ